MQETGRRVRTESDDTKRPYFSVNYKLSLSGRDLLALAFEEANGASRPSSPGASLSVADELHLQRRASDLTGIGHVGLGGSSSAAVNARRLDLADLGSESGAILDADAVAALAPGTPKGASQRRKVTGNKSQSPPVPKRTDLAAPGGDGEKTVRRIKSSATMREVELNRTAPPAPKALLQQPTLKIADAELLSGFVTCLNSRNVGKYKKGQRYRDGLILGIDEDHGKIIVYNDQMPRGALTILKTRDAARYERGYQVEDVRGKCFGTVHAVDRDANLIVLNTSVGVAGAAEEEILPPSLFPSSR